MSNSNHVKFADHGHKKILELIQKKHGLDLDRTFTSNYTQCAVATNSANEKVFIKVKGYEKNRMNERRHRRVANNYKLTGKSDNPVAPKLIEFHGFERDGILWITMLSAYGGESICKSQFFVGDDAIIDQSAIEGIRRSISTIKKIPASAVFYEPLKISRWIVNEFGRGALSMASEWASAHCDYHWANLLEGARFVVDWDMFSLAPKGFDLASILLFSSSNPRLFDRLYREFRDEINDDSCRVATLFAAARLFRMMNLDAYADMKIYQKNVRAAVNTMVGPGALDPGNRRGGRS